MRKAAAILTAAALAIGVLAGCSHFAASEDAGEAADHATERNGYQAGSEHSGSEGDAPSAADAVGDDTASDSASIEADAGNTEGGDDMQTNRIEVRADDATVVFEFNDSMAARELYGQLPLSVEVENFSTNEKIFYLPERLDEGDAPHAEGGKGVLAYYAPWGNVVMFYGSFSPNPGLYELGEAVSGADGIVNLTGTLTVAAVS